MRECLPCVTGALRSDFCAWPSARDLAWTRQSIDGTWTTRASSGNDRLLVTTDGTRAYGHAVAGDKIYLIETIGGALAVVDADRLGRPQPGPVGWQNDAVIEKSRWKSGGTGVAAAIVDSAVDPTADSVVRRQ